MDVSMKFPQAVATVIFGGIAVASDAMGLTTGQEKRQEAKAKHEADERRRG
jgi:hypothetical protein